MSLIMPKLLTPAETAEILKVSTGTLSQWRCHKRYPLAYIKVGNQVRYSLESVQKFLEENRVKK